MPAKQKFEPNIAPLELIDLERFFDLSVSMLCIANTDSTFRRVSPAFTNVLGWTAEELCLRPFRRVQRGVDGGGRVRGSWGADCPSRAVVELSSLSAMVGNAAQCGRCSRTGRERQASGRGRARRPGRRGGDSRRVALLRRGQRHGSAHEYAGRVFGIFEPLVGRSQAAGTGTGLAIVRKAVENHGGTIWADSEPGVGTTFPFILPRALTAGRERFPS